MTRHDNVALAWALAPPHRFGDGRSEGWSAMQLIETSSITIHADAFPGRRCIDVFSCRKRPEIAVAVAGVGDLHTLRVLQR